MSRRKVVVIVILAFFLVLLTTGVMAFNNEPDGFGGLKWGDKPKEGMEVLSEHDGSLFLFWPENVSTETSFTSYVFWDNRFVAMITTILDEEQYEFIKDFCVRIYGQWYDVKKELKEGFLIYNLSWNGEKADIKLWYDTQEEQGTWSMWSTVIMQEKEEAEKTAGGFGFQNEPDGFRGLKWGDPPTEDMVFIHGNEYGRNQYLLPDEKLQMGEAELVEIEYIFFDDGNYERLMEVWINTKDITSAASIRSGVNKDNYELLKELCKFRFGKETTIDSSKRIVWGSSKTLVYLTYDQYYIRGLGTVVGGTLVLSYLPIDGEYQEPKQKAEEDALRKSTAEDW